MEVCESGLFGRQAAFEEEEDTNMDVLGSSSLIVLMVSLDVKQHLKKTKTQTSELRAV